MQTFYFIVEPTMFNYEHFKVYAEDLMAAREKLKLWLLAEQPYYPAAPYNMNHEARPHLVNKEGRPSWRYLVK